MSCSFCESSYSRCKTCRTWRLLAFAVAALSSVKSRLDVAFSGALNGGAVVPLDSIIGYAGAFVCDRCSGFGHLSDVCLKICDKLHRAIRFGFECFTSFYDGV